MSSLNAGFTVSKVFQEMSRCGCVGKSYEDAQERREERFVIGLRERAPLKKPATIAFKKAKQKPLQMKLTFSKRKEESSMNTDKAGPQARNRNPTPRKVLMEDLSTCSHTTRCGSSNAGISHCGSEVLPPTHADVSQS